jgi:hypothetical protein
MFDGLQTELLLCGFAAAVAAAAAATHAQVLMRC